MTNFCKNNRTIGIYCPEPYLGGELSISKSIAKALSRRYRVNFYISNEFVEHLRDIDDLENITICGLNNEELVYKRFPKNNKETVLNRMYAGLSLVGIKFKKLPLKEKIVLFHYPSFEILMYPKLPCLLCIFDLRHKYGKQNKIKEIIKDHLFRKILKKPIFIIADSTNVKNDLINFYNIEYKKIIVMSPMPPLSEIKSLEPLSLIRKYNLPEEFLYYPAHIIPMKNHLNLIKAINQIKKTKGINVNLVFAGPTRDKECYRKLLDGISMHGLDNQVRYLGFLPYDEILTLYKLATALVMPSLFEGGGIPVLEAFYLGCPIVSSDASALPERVGDAGLLFDPNNIEDMAKKIYRIWTDENLRKELTQRGYERVKDMTFENYARKWEEIIEETLRSYD